MDSYKVWGQNLKFEDGRRGMVKKRWRKSVYCICIYMYIYIKCIYFEHAANKKT